MSTIDIKGSAFVVKLPPVDVVEELVFGLMEAEQVSGMRRVRVWAAMVCLCVPEVGLASGVNVAAARRDLVDHGGALLTTLRGKGWTNDVLVAAATQLFPMLQEAAMPSATEVKEAAGKSQPAPG